MNLKIYGWYLIIIICNKIIIFILMEVLNNQIISIINKWE